MGLLSALKSWLRPAKTDATAAFVQAALTIDGQPAPMTPEYERWARKLVAQHPDAAKSVTVNGQVVPMTPELAEMIKKALEQSQEPPAV